MNYNPIPIDTSDINLPEELLALTEKIAENVHDVWAAGRIAEGWTFGEKKDADKKTTPLLMPYCELPESEKEYDRRTAMETVKQIIQMGYAIEKIPNHIKQLMIRLYKIYTSGTSFKDNFFYFDYMMMGFYDINELEKDLDAAIELGLVKSHHKPKYDIISISITDYGMSYCKSISNS